MKIQFTNIIKLGLLTVCLLSTSVLAETILFGLKLGQSTLAEAQQAFILSTKKSREDFPHGWGYYTVSGEQLQFPDPQPLKASLHFDNNNVFGRWTMMWKKSDLVFTMIEQMLIADYPKLTLPNVKPGDLRKSFFQDDQTQISLMHSAIGGTHLDYIDLNYQKSLDQNLAKIEANKTKLSTNDNKGANR